MKTILRSLLPLFLIAFTVRLSAQSFNPTASAQGFNVFVSNNIIAGSGTTEGPVAMGGDLQLAGASIFAMNTSGSYPTGLLNNSNNYGMVIGGKINFASGNATQLNQGYLRVGTTTGARVFYTDCNNASTNLKLTPNSGDCNTAFNSYPNLQLLRQQTAGTPTNASGLDFASAFSQFSANAASVNDYSTATSTQINKIAAPTTNNPHITLQDNKVNVITLTPAQLANLNNLGSIIFDNHPAANRQLVFNVPVAGTLNWTMANVGGLSNSDGAYIIWNFYGTTALNVQGSNAIYGTVFAPLAAIVKTNTNNVYGQVIGKSFSLQSGYVSYFPFAASLPTMTAAASLSTLPVKLLSFSGSVADGKANLQWQVAQNEEGDYFIVEKSNDGTGFASRSLVVPTTNSGTERYAYKETLNEGGYYRLKLVSKDGNIAYSATVLLRATAKAGTQLEVLQNPITTAIAFRFTATTSGEGNVSIYTASGVRMLSKAVSVQKGSNAVTLAEGAALPRGTYLLHVQFGSEAASTLFIK